VNRKTAATLTGCAHLSWISVDSGLGLSHFSDLAAQLIARRKVSSSNSILNIRHLQAMIYGFQKRESIGIALPKFAGQPRR